MNACFVIKEMLCTERHHECLEAVYGVGRGDRAIRVVDAGHRPLVVAQRDAGPREVVHGVVYCVIAREVYRP